MTQSRSLVAITVLLVSLISGGHAAYPGCPPFFLSSNVFVQNAQTSTPIYLLGEVPSKGMITFCAPPAITISPSSFTTEGDANFTINAASFTGIAQIELRWVLVRPDTGECQGTEVIEFVRLPAGMTADVITKCDGSVSSAPIYNGGFEPNTKIAFSFAQTENHCGTGEFFDGEACRTSRCTPGSTSSTLCPDHTPFLITSASSTTMQILALMLPPATNPSFTIDWCDEYKKACNAYGWKPIGCHSSCQSSYGATCPQSTTFSLTGAPAYTTFSTLVMGNNTCSTTSCNSASIFSEFDKHRNVGILLCGVVIPQLVGSSSGKTWQDCQTACGAIGKRLCSIGEICPGGSAHPAVVTGGGDVWSPIDDPGYNNNWVQIGGAVWPICFQHIEIGGGGIRPDWGVSPTTTGKGDFYCC